MCISHLESVTYNKVQLVDVIVETLLVQKQQLASINHKLVVTGRYQIPVERHHGMSIHRDDLRNTKEEANVIIIHRVFFIVESSMIDWHQYQCNFRLYWRIYKKLYWCTKLCWCTFAMGDSLPVTCRVLMKPTSIFFYSGFSQHLGSPECYWISLLYSTSSCSLLPPPLTTHFPLRLFPGTGASNILLCICPSSPLLTCLFHFSLFSAIFFIFYLKNTFLKAVKSAN